MQGGPPEEAVLAFVFLFYGVIIFTVLAIAIGVCFLLYKGASGVPPQFRRTEPGMAFLLLIPLFGIVWIFIFTKNVSQSYQDFFRFRGVNRDDCGEQTGLWWGICSAASVIPCVGVFTGLASLVLKIVYIVKLFECKRLAESMPADGGQYGVNGGAAPYGTQYPTSGNPYAL